MKNLKIILCARLVPYNEAHAHTKSSVKDQAKKLKDYGENEFCMKVL